MSRNFNTVLVRRRSFTMRRPSSLEPHKASRITMAHGKIGAPCSTTCGPTGECLRHMTSVQADTTCHAFVTKMVHDQRQWPWKQAKAGVSTESPQATSIGNRNMITMLARSIKHGTQTCRRPTMSANGRGHGQWSRSW